MQATILTRKNILGIFVEGIGQSLTKVGLCFYYGAHPVPSNTRLEWVEGLLEVPGAISTSVDIFAGTWRTSAFTFPLSYFHAPILLAQQTLSDVALTGALDAEADEVPLGDPTLGGKVVYIGDETLLLGSWSGAGYVGCVRGLWGSAPVAHRSGARVYMRPPHWSMRRVEVWTYDFETGEEVCRWRGYLQGRPTSRQGTSIELECEEYFMVWRDGQIPRKPHNVNAGRALRVRGERWLEGPLLDEEGAPARPTTLSEARLASDRRVAAQIGDALVSLSWSADHERLTIGAIEERLASRLDLDVAEEGQAATVHDEPIWELLVWDRLGDLANTSRAISPTWGMPHAFHPVRVALALLRTDPALDPLGYGWGLGLTHINWSAWEEVIEQTPQLQLDQLIIGWDGDTTRIFEQIEQLLRSYGFLIVPRMDGSIGLVRFRTLALGDYAQAVANRVTMYDDVLQLIPPEDVGLTELRATVGELPWRPGRPIVVEGKGSSERAALLTDARRWEVDLSHLRAADAVRVASELAEGASLVHYGLPTLKIRVADGVSTGKDLNIGQLVALDPGTLRTSWFIDRDGQRISPADMPSRLDLVGWIVGRKQSLEDLSVELELRLLAYYSGAYTRERGPSVVINYADGGDVGCAQTFAGSPDDARTFTVGDQVELYSRAGERRLGGPWTVIDVGPAFLATSSSLSPGEPGDVAGDVVRLATSRYYSNSNRYTITDRPYTYLADEADQVGRPLGEDVPDIYGAGLGIG